jgi:hypothetical protein
MKIKTSINASIKTSILILKLIIPIYILSDILFYFDVLKYISFIFEPITTILNLPPESAIGLAAGILFNLYAAIGFLAPLNLSAYEWTIIAVFLGVAHSLIVENAIMKKLNISYLYSTLLRLSMAFISIIPLLFIPKSFFESSQENSNYEIIKYDNFIDLITNSFLNSLSLSIKVIVLITIIIFIMDYIKSHKLLSQYKSKFNSSFSIITGLILGITYGAGILINEFKSGNLSRADVFYIATFLMICHSIIEDTLLFVIFGANLWLIITIRLFFAILFSYILLRVYKKFI